MKTKEKAMNRIVVITGATSGLGKAFLESYIKQGDQVVAVGRNREKCQQIQKEIGEKTEVQFCVVDLEKEKAEIEIYEFVKQRYGRIDILINNAGFGKLGDFSELSVEDNGGMVRLNCEALTVFTAISLPYIINGGEIINSCSIASFAPNSRMAVYSSTKAYVMSFSRALREELKQKKINVLAVCPGPMDTEFLAVAGIEKGTSSTFDMLPRVNPKAVAIGSIKASKKKKAVYTNHIFYKFYRILAKILPHSLVMKMAKT